jgi:hypothetical protein
MNRKLFADWDTLNRVMKSRRAKQAQGGEMPQEEDFAGLLGNLDAVLEAEERNSRSKHPSLVPGQVEQTASMVHESLVVRQTDNSMVVVLVAKDLAEPQNNEVRHIHCPEGTGFGGYVRDVEKAFV